MESGQRKSSYRLRTNIYWFGAALLGAVACGGADNDDLLKLPSGQGGQSAAQGGNSSTSGSGGEVPGEADAGAGGQASSGGDAGIAGDGSATGGITAGGAGGKSTGGAGGKSTGGAGGKSTGGTAGASAGGQAGSAGARSGGAGGGGAGGRGGVGGASAGAAGAAATCPGKCDANADCSVASGAVTCTCRPGFVGTGLACARPTSCSELHDFAPSLASGAYVLKPARASTELTTYCEMAAEGGGWTLILNDGPSFEPDTQGVADAQCYRQDCTNLAYSTVPVVSDVMLDLRDGAIVAANYVARVTVVGVEARTRGKTVRELFTGGPYYLEREDNSNLSVRLSGTSSCSETLSSDVAALVCNSCEAGTTCDAPVITFGDADPGCVDNPTFAFAIGGSQSYTAAWGNCAGWPQQPNLGNVNYYPDNFRVWVR